MADCKHGTPLLYYCPECEAEQISNDATKKSDEELETLATAIIEESDRKKFGELTTLDAALGTIEAVRSLARSRSFAGLDDFDIELDAILATAPTKGEKV